MNIRKYTLSIYFAIVIAFIGIMGCVSCVSTKQEIVVTSSSRGLTGNYSEYRVTIDDLIKHCVKTNDWIIVIYDRYQ